MFSMIQNSLVDQVQMKAMLVELIDMYFRRKQFQEHLYLCLTNNDDLTDNLPSFVRNDNIQLNNYVYRNDTCVYHIARMKDDQNSELFVMKLYLNVNLQLLVDKKNKNKYQLFVMNELLS
jgi:hypothetical protein